MRYSCNMIKDLLPLYHDGVCSNESKKIIEQHLSECPDCKGYYEEMCKTSEMILSPDEIILLPPDSDSEIQKAASFQAIKKKLRRKQVLMSVLSITVIMAILFAILGMLKSSTDIVAYDDNISVSMVDGSLVGRLKGSQYESLEVKNVAVTIDEKVQNNLFFTLSDTKWDDLTTSTKVFSEYTLCPAEKSADEIDKVYYYTGNFEDLESMNNDELQKVINSSVLLWSK